MKKKKPVARQSRSLAKQLPKHAKRAAHKAVRRKLPRHRRALLHPATIFMLLCAGVFIVGLTYKSIADTIQVTAKVAAQPLTQGAVITDPVNGQTFTTTPITVVGTCPNNSYVKLYRNSAFSGVAWCSNGRFSIETALSLGLNTFVAKDFNITDDEGPATPPVNVTFAPPYPVVKNRNIAPLLLTAEYHFQAILVGGSFSWDVGLLGGSPAYTINIDWGDGSTSTLALQTDQTFSIKHRYGSSGYYPVKIQAADGQGDSAFLQIAALIKVPGVVGFTGHQTPKSGQAAPRLGIIQWLRSWLWLIWPIYLIVLLMALSYWLGEREEYRKLARRGYKLKRRHA